jgi:CheY-like chemotaxis protein
MLRRLLVAGVVATVALTPIDLGACGDKFLRPGRSGRWQNYAALHPAAILLYQSATAKPEVLKAWQAMLKKAGHKSQVVQSGDDFTRAVAAGQYDVVIADYSDAAKLNALLQAVPSKPGMLPFLNKPSQALVDEVKRHYQQLLSAKMDQHETLVTIDSLMERRQKATLTAAATR